VDNLQAIVVNYYVCFALGSFMQGQLAIPTEFWKVSWFPYSVILGALFIVGFNITAITVQKFGMAFTSIMQKMSLILPALFGIIVYMERVSFLKIMGLVTAFISIWMINLPIKWKSDGSMKRIFLLFPLIVFISSGLIEIALLFLDRSGIVENGDINFVSFIFGIAGILGTAFILVRYKWKDWTIKRKNILAGIALGVPNFFTIYLLVFLIDKGWEGSVLFPLNNMGVVILSTLTGFLVFTEKMNTWRWIGISLAVISIYLISM
jgi:uncharacterized membrane protein